MGSYVRSQYKCVTWDMLVCPDPVLYCFFKIQFDKYSLNQSIIQIIISNSRVCDVVAPRSYPACSDAINMVSHVFIYKMGQIVRSNASSHWGWITQSSRVRPRCLSTSVFSRLKITHNLSGCGSLCRDPGETPVYNLPQGMGHSIRDTRDFPLGHGKDDLSKVCCTPRILTAPYLNQEYTQRIYI